MKYIVQVCVALLAAALATQQVQAAAACRSISDDAARLRCYDAAFDRQTGDPSRTNAALDMAGAYIGIGAGADRGRAATVGRFGGVAPTDTSGAIVGVAGYNFFEGNMMFGVEAGLDIGLSRSALPSRLSSTDTAVRVEQLSYKELATPTLGIRFGHRVNDFLLYGRLSAGITLTHLTSQTSGFSITTDPNGITVENHIDRTKDRKVSLLGEVAGGVEYHFNRFFSRGELQYRHTFLDPETFYTNGYSRFRGTAIIGTKF